MANNQFWKVIEHLVRVLTRLWSWICPLYKKSTINLVAFQNWMTLFLQKYLKRRICFWMKRDILFYFLKCLKENHHFRILMFLAKKIVFFFFGYKEHLEKKKVSRFIFILIVLWILLLKVLIYLNIANIW